MIQCFVIRTDHVLKNIRYLRSKLKTNVFTLNNLIHNSKIESLLKLWVLITFLKSIKNIFSNSTKILLRNNSKQTNPKDTIISSNSLDFIQKWFKFSNIPSHSD